MKKLLVAQLVSAFFLVVPFKSTVADNSANVSLSASLQPSTWEGKNINDGTSFDANATALQLNLNISKGNFYGGLSFQGAEYKFTGGAPNQVTKTNSTPVDDATINRGEFDLVFGYYIIPKMSLFIDFKTIENDWKDDAYSLRYKGTGLGVNGYHPLNKDWLLIGSIGFIGLDIKANSKSIGDGTGSALTIGALYKINPRANFSIRLKAQHNEYDFDEGSEQEHDIAGLVFGFSYGL
jgi:hypothetical protein